jgi:hypothetical protein
MFAQQNAGDGCRKLLGLFSAGEGLYELWIARRWIITCFGRCVMPLRELVQSLHLLGHVSTRLQFISHTTHRTLSLHIITAHAGRRANKHNLHCRKPAAH